MIRPVVHIWYVPTIVPHRGGYAVDDCNPTVAISYDHCKSWLVASLYGGPHMAVAQWREP